MSYSSGSFGPLIENTINFGREDFSSNCKQIKDLNSEYENYVQTSHVMIYTKTDMRSFKIFEWKAFILMQMRSDGYIGFPGGFVDGKEKPVETVCRQVAKEMGWSEENGAVSESDYLFTHVNEQSECASHFYATEVTESKLSQIEKNVLNAPDYGHGVLGIFRVPLYTLGDAFKGFPSFLKNHFYGMSKVQLLDAIYELKLLTEEQIIQALYSAPRITK